MSTGASRLTRSVSPYRYSSATRSPTTAMRAPAKRSRSERSSALRCMEAVSLTNSGGAASSARGRRERLARPRLPAAGDPEPVIGMLPDGALHPASHFLRGRQDGGTAPGAGRGGERALHAYPGGAGGCPDGKRGQKRRAGAQGQHGGSRSGAGRRAEEVDEDAARWAHVLIDHHREDLAAPEEPQRRAGGSLVG